MAVVMLESFSDWLQRLTSGWRCMAGASKHRTVDHLQVALRCEAGQRKELKDGRWQVVSAYFTTH